MKRTGSDHGLFIASGIFALIGVILWQHNSFSVHLNSFDGLYHFPYYLFVCSLSSRNKSLPRRQNQLRRQRPVPPCRDKALRDIAEEDPLEVEAASTPSTTSSSTAISPAWSTAPASPWPPWTSSSTPAGAPPTSSMWAAAQAKSKSTTPSRFFSPIQRQGHLHQHLRRHPARRSLARCRRGRPQPSQVPIVCGWKAPT